MKPLCSPNADLMVCWILAGALHFSELEEKKTYTAERKGETERQRKEQRHRETER